MTHRPKKSLGQHFLRSAQALRDIVAAGELAASDTVLEIGPGEGVLTEKLLETGAHVVAIEKDRDLIPLLEARFEDAIRQKQLVLREGDVLAFDPRRSGLSAGNYKLVANIPYYITGAIFEKFLTEKNPPSRMVVLIQKEVATRIVARDHKESILSISVKAFGTPRIAAKVPASAFRPAPKVDSAVLVVSGISHKGFSGEGPAAMEHFFTVVRAAFAHKRKLLIRNLESVADKEKIADVFKKLDLPLQSRAEDLPPEIWFAVARALL